MKESIKLPTKFIVVHKPVCTQEKVCDAQKAGRQQRADKKNNQDHEPAHCTILLHYPQAAGFVSSYRTTYWEHADGII